MRRAIATLLLLAAPAAAAQDFDYWLLALSWSPSWCATEGDGDDAQCAPDRDLGFVLHGLWPQYEEGWPEWCGTPHPDPSGRVTAAMTDVTGSPGLAMHAWRKHGACTGLAPSDYFALSRFAFERAPAPALGARMTPAEVEAAFAKANPALGPDDLVVTCRDGLLREVRVCLDFDLAPRRCGADVLASACRARGPVALPEPP